MVCFGIQRAWMSKSPPGRAGRDDYKFDTDLGDDFPTPYNWRSSMSSRRGDFFFSRIPELTTPCVGPTAYIEKGPMPALFVPAGLAPAGVALLLEGFDCARDAETSPWDYAIDVPRLYEEGLSDSALRWLIDKKYA